ncbi:MAG TPA: aldolase [Niallia sp.]|nr:aldolase [Niallia sp.]
MLKVVEQSVYKAFDFIVDSFIPLPELPQMNIKVVQPDITIKKEDLLKRWTLIADTTDYFFVKENFIMFHIPEIAIFQIKDGKEISVFPMKNSTEDHLRLYILGTCMGAILIQRKILPLHGSAIAIEGKAYAIVGESGAGKSTLASAFLEKGYQLISDDVIPVTLNRYNKPIVIPSYPHQKLWLETLNQFGKKFNKYRPIVERETKYSIPVTSQFTSESLPLAGVFELIKTESENIEIRPIKKLNKLYMLYNHTYRNLFVRRSGLMEWHFNTTALIADGVPIYQLLRPESRFTAIELQSLILSTINLNKGEKINA